MHKTSKETLAMQANTLTSEATFYDGLQLFTSFPKSIDLALTEHKKENTAIIESTLLLSNTKTENSRKWRDLESRLRQTVNVRFAFMFS